MFLTYNHNIERVEKIEYKSINLNVENLKLVSYNYLKLAKKWLNQLTPSVI